MSIRTALNIWWAVVILPVMGFMLVNFYGYLFDGWQIGSKFGNAAYWLLVAGSITGIAESSYYDYLKKERERRKY